MTLYYLLQCYFSLSFFSLLPTYVPSLCLFSPPFSFKPLKLEEYCTASTTSFTNSHPASSSVFLYFLYSVLVKTCNSLVTKEAIIQLPEKKLLPASPSNNLTEFFQYLRHDSVMWYLLKKNSYNLPFQSLHQEAAHFAS